MRLGPYTYRIPELYIVYYFQRWNLVILVIRNLGAFEFVCGSFAAKATLVMTAKINFIAVHLMSCQCDKMGHTPLVSDICMICMDHIEATV